MPRMSKRTARALALDVILYAVGANQDSLPDTLENLGHTDLSQHSLDLVGEAMEAELRAMTRRKMALEQAPASE